MTKWIVIQNIEELPTTGEEFLTRNDNQGGIILLINYNTIHKHFVSKGDWISKWNIGTHYLLIPKK